MAATILVLGGYGNFGRRIVQALLKDQVAVIIAGRHIEQANACRAQLLQQYPQAEIRVAAIDVTHDITTALRAWQPSAVIHACGPFQGAGYEVVQACIRQQIHYIDLADGRAFVVGIEALDTAAQAAGVMVLSGASTVPGLSSAVIDHYQHEFSSIDSVRYGISPGQKAERGLATTQAILSYLGKPLADYLGSPGVNYGWQQCYRQLYPALGKRPMASCDVPDLDLFAKRYGVKTLQFSAGMESQLLHYGMWCLSWFVRLGLPITLPKYAKPLLALSHKFDGLGSDAGGMHMLIQGKDQQGQAKQLAWFIIARSGDGPQIPTIPAIVLAKRVAKGTALRAGARPCLGEISLVDYLHELRGFAVETLVYEGKQALPFM